MGFWKGAIGTKKQKIFWVVFSIIVALIAVVIIFFMMPLRITSNLSLYGGEWAHFYPDSFWHGSASYQFETVPPDGSAPVPVEAGAAHVYNINVYGVDYDFDRKAVGIDVVIGNSTMSKVIPNWNKTVTVTDGSIISVMLDDHHVITNPLDFIVTRDIYTLESWARGRKDLIKEKDYYTMIENTKEISATVDIASSSKFEATERIGVGIKVSEKDKIVSVKGELYINVAKVVLENSTNFTGGSAQFELGARQLLQVDAPEECTSDKSLSCRVKVTLEPRWGLYFGIVVIPVSVFGCLLVVGLMAIKAFHVRQMIAMMRKKATEEGVALEEGKSKDIHQERLDEANAEGDISEPHESDGEGEGVDDVDETKEKKKSDDDTGGAAVMTSN